MSANACRPQHNPEAQLEARAKEHTSGRHEEHITKCTPSNQVHPVPKNAHVPSKHTPSRRAQSKIVSARGTHATETLRTLLQGALCAP